MTSPYSSSWPSSSSVMPAASASSARVRITSVSRPAVVVGTFAVAHARRGGARLVGFGGAPRHLEERLGGGRLAPAALRRGSRARSPTPVRFGGAAPARTDSSGSPLIELIEPFLDHLERQEVLALLAQDEAQALDVGGRELAVSRRRALGIDETLALEEPDLRDRDVGELRAELIEHVADRDTCAPSPRQPSRGSAPSTKLSR